MRPAFTLEPLKAGSTPKTTATLIDSDNAKSSTRQSSVERHHDRRRQRRQHQHGHERQHTREADPEQTADEKQYDRLGQQLTGETPPPSAERRAQRDLSRARGRPGQHDAGDVRAGRRPGPVRPGPSARRRSQTRYSGSRRRVRMEARSIVAPDRSRRRGHDRSACRWLSLQPPRSRTARRGRSRPPATTLPVLSDPIASHTSHDWIPVPWKPGAATPTTVTGRPLIRSVRPTIAVVTVESPPPVVIVEDRGALVAVGEHTPTSRRRPERGEEIRRDRLTENRLGVRRPRRRQSHDVREQSFGEHARQ